MGTIAYNLEACRSLGYAVLARAVRDIKHRDHQLQEAAVRFLRGAEADRWCEALDLDVRSLRNALEPGGMLYAHLSH